MKGFSVLDLVRPKARRLHVERRVHVRLGEERLQAEQDGLDAVRRRPLLLQDVKANIPVRVDVRVESR